MSLFARERLEERKAEGMSYDNAAEWREANDIVAGFLEHEGLSALDSGDKLYAEPVNNLCHDYIFLGRKLYQIGQELGSGGFGYVKIVTDEEGNQFALKINGWKVRNSVVDQILVHNEKIWLLAQDRLLGTAVKKVDTKRPKFEKGYEHTQSTRLKKSMLEKDYSLQPLANGVELKKIIDENNSHKQILIAAEKYSIALAVTRELRKFHRDYNAVHRDLKPDNIFYDSATGQATLIDFGLSQEVDDCPIPGGTFGYTPPEMDGFDGCLNRRVNTNQDVYALGSVFSQLGIAREIISSMCAKDPMDRPSLQRVEELLDEQLRVALISVTTSDPVAANPVYIELPGIPMVEEQKFVDGNEPTAPAVVAKPEFMVGSGVDFVDDEKSVVRSQQIEPADFGSEVGSSHDAAHVEVVAKVKPITPFRDAQYQSGSADKPKEVTSSESPDGVIVFETRFRCL